jgi:murein endopeptidase
VHPAIKKVRWGHFYHFHVRITCPPGSGGCEAQKPVSGDDGCGTELDDWFKKLRQAEMHPAQPGKPVPGKPPLALDDLPKECRTVLNSPGGGTLRFCLLQRPLSISRPARRLHISTNAAASTNKPRAIRKQ